MIIKQTSLRIACAAVFLLLSLAGRGQSDEYDYLLQEAETISDPYKKASSLADIAGKYIQAGDIEKASDILSASLQTTRRIKLPGYQVIVYIKVAERYSQAGMGGKTSESLSKALSIVEPLKYGRYKDNFLSRIAVVYAGAGYKENAFKIANEISDSDIKVATLQEIEESESAKVEKKVQEEPVPVVAPVVEEKAPEKVERAPAAQEPETRREETPEAVTTRADKEGDETPPKQYRAIWVSVGAKDVTPSLAAGLRVKHFGLEVGGRSSDRSLGGNYGLDVLLFINPYNRLSLYGGLGIYQVADSGDADIALSIGIQSYLSKTFVFGLGYHRVRGFYGSLGIGF